MGLQTPFHVYNQYIVFEGEGANRAKKLPMSPTNQRTESAGMFCVTIYLASCTYVSVFFFCTEGYYVHIHVHTDTEYVHMYSC